MAAALTVPLAAGTATASAKAPHGFNKAVAAKFILRNDRMRPAARGAHVRANIAGVPGYGSSNWSGYAEGIAGGGTYSKVSGSWVEPSITCDGSDSGWQLAAFWVGIDGANDGTVEQDGTIEECYQGIYEGAADWWEMYPANSVQFELGVTAGAKISASVSINRAGKYVLSVKDPDNDASFHTTQKCTDGPCNNASAEWIGEAPCCNGSYVYDLAQWSPYWKVTAAKVTGSDGSGTISSYDGGAQEGFIEMFGDQTGNPTADVTATNHTGTSFRDYWLGYN
jgi:hypothetical protein